MHIMAVKGSGVVAKTIDPVMHDRISQGPAVDPRAGKAKRTQTSFPIKEGMKDQTEASKLRGISPSSPGFSHAPDASSGNPLDPSPTEKILRRQTSQLKASWGMLDANGQSVNGVLGKAILDEAGRLGR
jgi:hypothetical protein